MSRRRKVTLADKRHELREVARGYFEAKRSRREAYTDMSLARTIVAAEWKKVKPVATLLAEETLADWLATMARAATEVALRADQPDIPGVILYREEGSKERRRKSIKGSTLGELRSYRDMLAANAGGALEELRKVNTLIQKAEEAGCGEDDGVWPYISDEPALPLGLPPSLAEGRDDPSASGPDGEPEPEGA